VLVGALASEDERVNRLTEADATACLRLEDRDDGITLVLQGARPAVLTGTHPAEIELSLGEAQFAELAAGRLVLAEAILHGELAFRGPVGKLLSIDPVLRSLLRDVGAGEPQETAADTRTRVGSATSSCTDHPGMPWAMQCVDVYKRFGANSVLRGVSVGIPEGLITVVLGPSGTGKSVLIQHLTGLLGPDAGEVLFRGQALRSMSRNELLELRRRFGILFQDGALWGSMSVYDNVALPLRQHTDLREAEIATVVRGQLARVGLTNAETRMPSELSGGMRKRAGFARALVLDPEVVFFDEPDSGLDPVRTALLCDLISEIHATLGGTYAIVTHDINTARRLGDYVVVLWRGKVEEAGLANDVLASSNPFVEQFLAGATSGPLGMD
jgi:phospholipid/cholesterol/gamma-HCH transport system ATP-binding protein